MTCITPGVPHVSDGSHACKKPCVSYLIDIDPHQLPIAWKYNRYSRDKELLSIFLFATADPDWPSLCNLISKGLVMRWMGPRAWSEEF